MKRFVFGILTTMLMLGLSGCSDNTDLVKDGIMNFNKTITVGNTFDNWKDCENSEWSSFETDNKTPVVQVNIWLKLKAFYLKKNKKKLLI